MTTCIALLRGVNVGGNMLKRTAHSTPSWSNYHHVVYRSVWYLSNRGRLLAGFMS